MKAPCCSGARRRLPFRSHDGTLCTRPDPARCNASSTFAWWAPPNLQAQLLSRGDLPLADGYLWPQALQPTVNPAWRPYGRSAFNRTLHARSSGLTLTHTDVHLTLTHTNMLRAPRGLGLQLPNSSNSPDLVLCGSGGERIGSDAGAAAGLAAVHDLLARTLGAHGRSGYLCYYRNYTERNG